MLPLNKIIAPTINHANPNSALRTISTIMGILAATPHSLGQQARVTNTISRRNEITKLPIPKPNKYCPTLSPITSVTSQDPGCVTPNTIDAIESGNTIKP